VPAKPLRDRIALVTGGGRCIGKAIALTLGCDGAHVVVNYNRSRIKAQTTAREIADLGVRAAAFRADVSKPRQVEEVFVSSRSGSAASTSW